MKTLIIDGALANAIDLLKVNYKIKWVDNKKCYFFEYKSLDKEFKDLLYKYIASAKQIDLINMIKQLYKLDDVSEQLLFFLALVRDIKGDIMINKVINDRRLGDKVRYSVDWYVYNLYTDFLM